ncbi:hypothetical protein SKAU_G00048440 [Synaphobranchus kaupii]|uniref:Uncharacterized protein n=1 Tax=Synaphobranchus kaupii TaxID=118154 RepID=A0A9Q1J7C3_SYNKA|nr:hypothetical protein SKAU_G00048440 [Synaphobranchus kaupii]
MSSRNLEDAEETGQCSADPPWINRVLTEAVQSLGSPVPHQRRGGSRSTPLLLNPNSKYLRADYDTPEELFSVSRDKHAGKARR